MGVGRIGAYHALHLQELAAERGDCVLVAVADRHGDTAGAVASRLGVDQSEPIRAFPSPEALVEAGVADAVVVASRTADHRRDATALVEGGLRILLEKPLAGTLHESRDFVAWLDAHEARRSAVMLAFQRRYDPAMLRARELLEAGAIGRLFKIVSVLEDPAPPPAGYESPGLLVDMGVHNADEILWLGGRAPTAVAGFGGRLHNQTLPGVTFEEHDDALIQLWMGAGCTAQLTVSRNHVAGYRNECVLYGRDGLIHVGPFEGDARRVRVRAVGVDHEPLEDRVFELRDYGPDAPVFIQRFGAAYKAEAADFIDRCIDGRPFAVTHGEGLAAMEVVAAGATAVSTGTAVRLTAGEDPSPGPTPG